MKQFLRWNQGGVTKNNVLLKHFFKNWLPHTILESIYPTNNVYSYPTFERKHYFDLNTLFTPALLSYIEHCAIERDECFVYSPYFISFYIICFSLINSRAIMYSSHIHTKICGADETQSEYPNIYLRKTFARRSYYLRRLALMFFTDTLLNRVVR